MSRKICFSVMILFVLAVVLACGKAPSTGGNKSAGAAKAADTVFKMKVAGMYAMEHSETVALYRFKDILEKNSDGGIAVEIYPNCQLGTEQVFNDSLMKGVIEMALPGQTMAKYLPKLALGEMPFVFNDWDHAKKILAGPIGEAAFEGVIEKVGVRALGWSPMGFGIIASSKPIAKFEDLKGLRLRVPPIAHFIEFAKAMGCNPIPNTLTEFYTSMEQKVADACTVPYSILYNTKVYELTPYVYETNHMLFTHAWYVNEKFFQKLPKKFQDAILSSAKEAIEINWQLAREDEKKQKEFMMGRGIKIFEVDGEYKSKMKKASVPIDEWYFKTYPGIEEIVKKIKA